MTPALNAGGVERTTLEIADAISRAGGLALVASAGGRLEPDLKAAGGELIKLPLATKNPITAIANAFALARVIRKRGVAIVHARSRAPAWSAWLAAKLTGAHFVTTFHGIYNARSAPKRFYNSIMARGEVVIANSEYTREHVVDQFRVRPERVIAIPRGADLAVFDPARFTPEEIAAQRAAWGLTENDPRCVVIVPARLTRWKGQMVMIEAAAELNKRRPDLMRVIFAGDAQGRSNYESGMKGAISVAGLKEVASIVGHLRDMPLALAASDIAVFPVIEPEAFGRGAVEAQAMGVPVIASSLGGFTETIVENETGMLVPANASQELAAALERMIDAGPEGRRGMGAKGIARAHAHYAIATLQAATLAVYQRVLAGKRTSQARGDVIDSAKEQNDDSLAQS